MSYIISVGIMSPVAGSLPASNVKALKDSVRYTS